MKKLSNITGIILLILVLFSFLTFAAYSVSGQTAETDKSLPAVENALPSGGQFTLLKTFVGGGGGQAQQNQLAVQNTTGQSVAGNVSNGGQFRLFSGFWTPEDYAPTAAAAVVGGRIKTAAGQGIRNVRISIAFPNGETRSTLSASFGYYRFTDIPAGATYVFSVSAKNYTFAQSSQIHSVTDDLQNIDFIAEP